MCIELSFYNILAKSSKGLFLHSLVKLPKFFLLKNLWYLENISSTYCTLRCNQRVVLNLRFHPWEICAVPFSPVKCTYTCLIQISLQNGLNKYCFSSLAFLLFNLRLIHFLSFLVYSLRLCTQTTCRGSVPFSVTSSSLSFGDHQFWIQAL